MYIEAFYNGELVLSGVVSAEIPKGPFGNEGLFGVDVDDVVMNNLRDRGPDFTTRLLFDLYEYLSLEGFSEDVLAIPLYDLVLSVGLASVWDGILEKIVEYKGLEPIDLQQIAYSVAWSVCKDGRFLLWSEDGGYMEKSPLTDD